MGWSFMNVLLLVLLVEGMVWFLVVMMMVVAAKETSFASQRGALSRWAMAQQWSGDWHGRHRLCASEKPSREVKVDSNPSCRYYHGHDCQLASTTTTTTARHRDKWVVVCYYSMVGEPGWEGREGEKRGRKQTYATSSSSSSSPAVVGRYSNPWLQSSHGSNKNKTPLIDREVQMQMMQRDADTSIGLTVTDVFSFFPLRSFVSLAVSGGGWTPRLLLTRPIYLRLRRKRRRSIGIIISTSSKKKKHRLNTEVFRLRQKTCNSAGSPCFLLPPTTASSQRQIGRGASLGFERMQCKVGQAEVIRREKLRQGRRATTTTTTTTPLIPLSAALAGGFSSSAAWRQKVDHSPSVSREDLSSSSGRTRQYIRRRVLQLPALQVSPKEGVSFSAPHRAPGCLKIGIVRTKWNSKIVDSLEKGVREGLASYSVGVVADISSVEVPGSYELPLATKWLCLSGEVDAVVAIGCLVKGETMHFEYISDSVSHGLMNVQLNTQVPVVFGVLSVINLQQAEARSSGPDNHGVSWGHTAVEMALLRKAATGEHPSRREIGFSNEAKTLTESSTTNGSGLSSADLAAQQTNSAQERGFPSERLFRKEDDDDDASKQRLPRKAPQWYF